MNILIATLDYPPQIGGVASYVSSYAKELAKQHQIVLYVPKNNKKIETHEDNNSRIKIYHKKQLYKFLWPRWLKLLFDIYFISRREKIEQLHIHHALPVGYVGFIIKKILHVPYILFLHGSDVRFAAISSSKLKKFAHICAGAQQIVVNSKSLKKDVLTYVPKLTNINVVYPCPADYFFKPFTLEKIDITKQSLGLMGKKVIISPARITTGKGFFTLAKIFPEIIKQMPNVVWLIVGDGQKRNQLLKYIQQVNIQPYVRYLGPIEKEKMPELYRVSNICVVLTHETSSSKEGFGTVFLEAGAMGIPVIAGECGGTNEAVEHSITGIVLDTKNEKVIISSIIDLLRNNEFGKSLGKAAQERVYREFTWEKQLKKLTL